MTSGPVGVDHPAGREYSLRKAVGLSALMCLLALWSRPLDAQMNGHNALGDFGVLSGSQPAPGFYAAGMWYSYGSDRVLDRDGNPLSLLPSADPTTLRVNAFVGLLWWVTDKQILGANYGIVVAPALANVGLEVPALGADLRIDWGLAALYVQPVNLGWHLDRADFHAGLGVYVPIGRYDVDASDNVGLGKGGVVYDPEELMPGN